MKTTLLIVGLSALAFASLRADEPQVLNIKKGDASVVQIELRASDSPQVIVFLKFPQLKEAQKIISDNYRKKLAIQVNGKTVSEPIIQIEPPYKGASIAISASDVGTAVKLAQEIIAAE